eukprot:3106085-Rhodomonas_salina.1
MISSDHTVAGPVPSRHVQQISGDRYCLRLEASNFTKMQLQVSCTGNLRCSCGSNAASWSHGRSTRVVGTRVEESARPPPTVALPGQYHGPGSTRVLGSLSSQSVSQTLQNNVKP